MAVNSEHLRQVACRLLQERAQNLPIIRDLTTSTGEPTQTATNPAPRPEKRWQTTLSLNMPVASRLCLICSHHSTIRTLTLAFAIRDITIRGRHWKLALDLSMLDSIRSMIRRKTSNYQAQPVWEQKFFKIIDKFAFQKLQACLTRPGMWHVHITIRAK